ncbi:MAG: hypothetical protein AAF560_27830 [Acidobacteriota bacterium]
MFTIKLGSRRLRQVGLLLAALSLTTGCATVTVLEKEPVDVTVEHILQSITEAIDTVYERHGGKVGLEIAQVSVQLQTAVNRSSGEDIKISLVQITGSESESFTQSITVTLQPPKEAPADKPTAPAPAYPKLAKDLEKGIEGAMLAAHGAKQGLERLHPDGVPLGANRISADVSFTVSTTGNGLPSISILGISLQGSSTKQRVHSVSMTFEIVDDSADSSK